MRAGCRPPSCVATTVPASRRILLVRLSHLGDVVSALPVFHTLRRAHPEARIGWAIQEEFAGLVEGLPGLERMFLFGRRAGLAAWTRLRAELLDWRPDWTVDAQGNVKSAMVALTSGAARRTGLDLEDWAERFAGHTLTDRAAPSGATHAVERMLALCRHLGAAAGAEPSFDLGLTDAERRAGRAALAERFPRGRGPGWILHLAAEDDVRSWPAAHYAALARELAARGRPVLVLSGPAEAPLGRRLAAEVSSDGDIGHWVGQQGLRGLAAFFAAAAEARVRVVACDSGPAHVAAAAGAAVRLLIGPQDPARTGPWPPPGRPGPHRVLASPDPPACMPCFARVCAHPAGPVCMQGLEPRWVAAELAREP